MLAVDASLTCVLPQELIEAKMKAASAALEHDTQAKSSPGATGHGSGKEDDLVHQIIEAKMTAASLALEKDEQGKRIVGLKRLIQHYAERVATLEVAAAKNASSRLSPTLSPNATNVLLSGPLYFKKNSSMFNSSWKWEKRYFELQADRIVYFSKEGVWLFYCVQLCKIIANDDDDGCRWQRAQWGAEAFLGGDSNVRRG